MKFISQLSEEETLRFVTSKEDEYLTQRRD